MFNIIPQIVIVISIAGILFVIGRKMPTLYALSEEDMERISAKKRESKSLVTKIRSIDLASRSHSLIGGLEKSFRRTRVFFLKIENLLGRVSERLRKKSQEISLALKKRKQQQKLDFRKANVPVIQAKKESYKTSGINVEFVLEKEEKSGITELQNVKEENEKDMHKEFQNTENNKEQILIEAIAKNPKNITMYKKLGIYYYDKRNFRDAKASFAQAIKLGSRDRVVKARIREINKLLKKIS